MSTAATYNEMGRVVQQLADLRTQHGKVPVDMLNDAAERVGRSPRHMLRLVQQCVTNGALPTPPPRRGITVSPEQTVLARQEWFKWAGNKAAAHEALTGNPDFPPMSYRTFVRLVRSWPDYMHAAASGGFGEMMQKQGVITEHIPYRTHTYGIDHTKLPIRVRKSRTSPQYETPWLTAVLDLHSRCMMSWKLSFETPTAETVLEVLAEAFVVTESDDGPFGGIPEHLRSDNGSDMQSNAVRHALLDLGVGRDFTVAYKPRWNGRKERNWRTIKERFAPDQPGFNRGSDNDKELRVRQIPVDVTSLLTLEEVDENLKTWVNAWLHQLAHPEFKNLTRMQVWHASPQAVRAPEDFDVWAAMLHRETRVLQRYGIEFQHSVYQHPDLAALFARSHGKPTVEVRSSRRIPDRIFVFNDGEFLCSAGRAQDMSAAEIGALVATRDAQDEKAERVMIAATQQRGLDTQEQIRRRDSEPEKAPSGLEFLDEDDEDIEFTDLTGRKEAS